MTSRVLKTLAALLTGAVLIFTSAGCDKIIADLSNSVRISKSTSGNDPAAETPSPEPTDERQSGIPFGSDPEVVTVPLPAEDYADDLEKEASDIIDHAIAAAVSCVNVMRDDRHGKTSFEYDAEAGGAFDGLSEAEKELLCSMIDAAYEQKTFRIEAADFDGDLKKAFFKISSAMLAGADPFITSFVDIEPVSVFPVGAEETEYRTVYSFFFNAYKDQNEKLSEGDANTKHDMDLLDRIVKRIVRFMPEDLTAYDKYYYLAAVLSEHVMYDDRRPSCFTAFGALVEGRAVCEGYSLAYLLLCREADLWCALRCGLPDGTGHQWNMVKLDTGIYNVDVTWCDVAFPAAREWYGNFVRSDEVFEESGHAITSGVSSTGVFEPNPFETR